MFSTARTKPFCVLTAAHQPCCAGMAPDVERLAAPDPSALIARQVGVQLKELSSSAPLFDGACRASAIVRQTTPQQCSEI